MSSNDLQIDPTEPEFSYQRDEDDDLAVLQDGFDDARAHFPWFMDVTVAVQVYSDLTEMADLRFTGLFDSVLENLTDAAQTYDEAHPDVERHRPYGVSALPNWQAVIGLELDETLVINKPYVVQQTHPHQSPIDVLGAITTHRPVIQNAALAGLYHSYNPNDGEPEMVCSYLDDELLDYDYCVFLRQVDIRDFNFPPLYLLDTDTYRSLLIELVEAKVYSLHEAEQTRNMRHVFEGYAAPLVYTVQDFTHHYDADS